MKSYTEIRAPFAGVVTAKRAFVGEAVSPFGSSPSGGGSGGAIACRRFVSVSSKAACTPGRTRMTR